MFRKIVVAHDGSVGGAKAFDKAVALAKAHGARLLMICVEVLVDFPETIEEVMEEEERARSIFDKVVERAERAAAKAGVKFKADIRAGHVAKVIIDYIESQRADLLVVGFHGHGRLLNRIIGGTTDRLARLSPCSVLIVK